MLALSLHTELLLFFFFWPFSMLCNFWLKVGYDVSDKKNKVDKPKTVRFYVYLARS